MHANNEVGTIQPIEEISKIAKKHRIILHTDAAQSVGKIDTNVNSLGADLLSVAGHKIYAPKGIGALYIREGTPIEPLVHGAGHESGRRAGTENVLLIVGLGKACEIARKYLNDSKIRNLRDRFWDLLKTLRQNRPKRSPYRLPRLMSGCWEGGKNLIPTGRVAAYSAVCHWSRGIAVLKQSKFHWGAWGPFDSVSEDNCNRRRGKSC
jgi:cysteine sulfinate desulfinase/cysteine desulfurase-like protein